MDTRKRKRYIIGLIISFSLLIVLKIAILDNFNVLFTIAEGLDQPSKGYLFVQEKIYKLAERKNIYQSILQYLEEDKNKHLHNLYIKTLGVIGNYRATGYLLGAYSKYQSNEEFANTVWYIINSMGMIGNDDLVPLLATLLKNYNKHDMQVTRYSLARSLYLITGERFEYHNDAGEKTKIALTNDLKNARQVIVGSVGRKRTYKEMIILDKLYRPPAE